jgi:hypothetical protein
MDKALKERGDVLIRYGLTDQETRHLAQITVDALGIEQVRWDGQPMSYFYLRGLTREGTLMNDQMDDLLETAWGIIANAGGGNWDTQSLEWQLAAARWRDRYHEALSLRGLEQADND